MRHPWPTKPLGELVKNRELSYGIVQPGNHVPSGVPIVRVKDLQPGRVDTHDPLCVAPSVSARHQRTVLRGGEVLISIVGTVGQSVIVPSSLADWNVARAIAVIRPCDVSSKWIEICLQYPEIQAALSSRLNTTVQATLNLSDLKRLPIPLPPARERDAIAGVITALDDKIAANHRLVNAVGEYLGCEFARLCAGTAFGTLRDIAAVNTTVTRPVIGGTLRYLDISAVSFGGYSLPSAIKWEQAPGRARRVVKVGDTVWSTVRPNRRSHALILDDDPLIVGSTGLAVLSPREGRIACTYESARREEFVQYLESVAEGSAYPAVRADRFNDAPVPALRDDQWDHYESIALPLRRRSHAATVEIRSLAAMRNQLLPLLISGKIHVREAEKVVEGVV
jgi:type I restriction enzyme S subunit